MYNSKAAMILFQSEKNNTNSQDVATGSRDTVDRNNASIMTKKELVAKNTKSEEFC